MTRHTHTPLGRHLDPRYYRFALPNKVWEFRLSRQEFAVLSYLYYHHAHGQGASLSVEAVARQIHLTTAGKYIDTLLEKGYITSDYKPTFRCKNGELYFALPNEVFLLTLSPSALMVYAYLLYREDRSTHQCHPSYRTIAADTGLSSNTVMKAVSALIDRDLIAMEHTSYYDKHGNKQKGNNLYTILPVRPAVGDFCRRQLGRRGMPT